MNSPKISPEMTIAEVIKIKPEAVKILKDHGMHCLGCSISTAESLRAAAEVHGIELEKLISVLNS
ncbi:MAG: DUF1858 domain-containing protein [Candidatus Riflebacteria bacterium]|nr:DUF1858 domain-containing protein [Candidatus Riflebacteria bacterium]